MSYPLVGLLVAMCLIVCRFTKSKLKGAGIKRETVN